jgi:hypothetical protein
MSTPETRISEFLRQYKMGSGQHPKDITGVYKDLDSTMAMLTVTDLEALLTFVGDVREAVQSSQSYEDALDDVGSALETLGSVG